MKVLIYVFLITKIYLFFKENDGTKDNESKEEEDDDDINMLVVNHVEPKFFIMIS